MNRVSEDKHQSIVRLIQDGNTVLQTASALEISHTTVWRHLRKAGMIRRPLRRWTEKEKELAIKWYSMGKGYEYIAKRLGRTQNAVEIFFCRRRKSIRNDSEKQQVLKVLSFCMSPTQILKTARKAGLLEEIKRNEEGA